MYCKEIHLCRCARKKGIIALLVILTLVKRCSCTLNYPSFIAVHFRQLTGLDYRVGFGYFTPALNLFTENCLARCVTRASHHCNRSVLKRYIDLPYACWKLFHHESLITLLNNVTTDKRQWCVNK